MSTEPEVHVCITPLDPFEAGYLSNVAAAYRAALEAWGRPNARINVRPRKRRRKRPRKRRWWATVGLVVAAFVLGCRMGVN